MGAFFYHTQITKAKIFGILLGFAGCLICILTQKSSELATNPLLGNICCLGSTFLYSAYLVVSKRLLKTIDTITFNKWTFLGGAIAATGVILFRGFHAPVLECPLFSTPMLALLFVLIFSSTISYFLVAIGLKCLPATIVALYGYVILIVAMIASYILKQDTFEWVQLLAGCMIIASIYFVEIMGGRQKD